MFLKFVINFSQSTIFRLEKLDKFESAVIGIRFRSLVTSSLFSRLKSARD